MHKPHISDTVLRGKRQCIYVIFMFSLVYMVEHTVRDRHCSIQQHQPVYADHSSPASDKLSERSPVRCMSDYPVQGSMSTTRILTPEGAGRVDVPEVPEPCIGRFPVVQVSFEAPGYIAGARRYVLRHIIQGFCHGDVFTPDTCAAQEICISGEDTAQDASDCR